MATRRRNVCFFGAGKAEGHAGEREFLGGKGANLAEMTRIGLPVPAGFTIPTEVCSAYYARGRRFPRALREEVRKALGRVERVMGARFGDERNPLLVSVRSGARVSMPGMMDTVLNLGLNDRTVRGLVEQTGNERFAYDSYRRFVQMYGDVVMGMRPENAHEIDPFERLLAAKKRKRRVRNDTDLRAEDLEELVGEFKEAIRKGTGQPFPEDPYEQLWGAVGAVFGSWMNERAITYRHLNGIPSDWGTAVNVQAMVFGNLGEDSGTGVAFTRDPATGRRRFYGEFLLNAQGEDVVAGIRTPQSIEKLRSLMPGVYRQLLEIQGILEKHYRDMQDIEFTIQRGKLWMLQTRVGKRTGQAAVRIAVDMVHEGLITREEALRRVTPEQLQQFLSPVFDPEAKGRAVKKGRVLAAGRPAGPGAACGRVVFSSKEAVERARHGTPVILVRIETSADDIQGMNASAGILTAKGGMTSHAALVARQMGKVCVAGCRALDIDYKRRSMKVGGKRIREGDWISIDGTTGEVLLGRIETRPSEVVRVVRGESRARSKDSEYGIFRRIMTWADEVRRLRVRANADQPNQAKLAVALGAEGIGLCRTEHMFFGEGRIEAVQEMILADDSEARRKALARILPIQRKDFAGLFRVMGARPVTIRTLDPPLHEFLPETDKEIRALGRAMGIRPAKLRERIERLKEQNPMLGHRGCRLGILYSEITEMQARAMFEAACDVRKEGKKVHLEIMIPLVSHRNELREQERVVRRVAEETFARRKVRVAYLVGTMIELPRAALTADRIAEVAEFFSFGTNDLTQTTFGMSRDDAGKFLPHYLEQEIFPEDPFISIDQDGVGELVRIAAERGRATRKDMPLGICGEHGGDAETVRFCDALGLDYVSCSPFRVPIARLAAAHATLRNREEGPGGGRGRGGQEPSRGAGRGAGAAGARKGAPEGRSRARGPRKPEAALPL